MQRYFIRFSYDGTDFHGFQSQPNAGSVQAELERALALLLRQTVEITGAGRTDAGVHARKMTAHFDLPSPLDTAGLAFRLNKILPQSIAILRIEPVPNDMHARFSARRRTYNYFIHTAKDPFINRYSALITYPLDFSRMNEAALLLLTTGDFAAFCKSGTDAKTTLCRVTDARWIQTSDHTWRFTITANRFLRNMVRAIVGTLIDVGRGKLTIDDFREIIAKGNRSDAGESMPAHALFLEDVSY
ncbi:MAG: tRNA pseudouridine(38-40) synthase TruA [Prevotella sp.]|nr:tRNA pseudouridine(38-40) synthase TruA [Prevotella sp.]